MTKKRGRSGTQALTYSNTNWNDPAVLPLGTKTDIFLPIMLFEDF